jgi:hypothetical protein
VPFGGPFYDVRPEPPSEVTRVSTLALLDKIANTIHGYENIPVCGEISQAIHGEIGKQLAQSLCVVIVKAADCFRGVGVSKDYSCIVCFEPSFTVDADALQSEAKISVVECLDLCHYCCI